MIDNIQKYENDKKRKKENEETMLFNSQIIDYILNQTSICDSQTNINLKNSFNNNNNIDAINNKHVSNRKVVMPANKPSNLIPNNALNDNYNNLNKKEKEKDWNKNKNNDLNIDKSNKNHPAGDLQKEPKGDYLTNFSSNNLDLFSKFEKLNSNTKLKIANFNGTKSNGNFINKNEKLINNNEEKSFVSMEFLIEVIEKAEKTVSKNPQTHRDSNKFLNILHQASTENLMQNPLILSHRGITSKKFTNEKSQKIILETNKIDPSVCNKENLFNEIKQLQEKSKNVIKENEKQNSEKHFSKNGNLKKSFSKAKQNQNQLENASTFNTADAGNSNLTAKDKKYLTRNEIILNNLLLKNSLNKEVKSNISNNNNFRSPNARITNNNSDVHNDNFKNEERENSIAKQRRKLEMELNLHNCLNEYNICNKNEDLNKEEKILLNFQSPQVNKEIYSNINNDCNSENKENNKNFEITQRSLSRNLLNFNCISTINNPSTEKTKTRICTTDKQMSTTQREKESQLLINRLNSHNHLYSSKNSGSNNTNILSSKENLNLKILFNKTNIDFGTKAQINSHRTSQNFFIDNKKNNKANNNVKNKKNNNLPDQQSINNLISTENNHNQTMKNNLLSKSQFEIFSNNIDNIDPNLIINNKSIENLSIKGNDKDLNKNISRKSITKNFFLGESANKQNRIKVILQSGNTINKDEIKINSYRSKENNNNFNRSNNTNNTKTAREVKTILFNFF